LKSVSDLADAPGGVEHDLEVFRLLSGHGCDGAVTVKS